MAANEKPHFSERVLSISEQAQHAIGHSAVSQAAVRAFTGSRSPAYRLLDWQSKGVQMEDHEIETVKVPGNPNATRLSRYWNVAAVIASEVALLDTIKNEYAQFEIQEAVAYFTDGTAHVGTLQAAEGQLFQPYAEDQNDEITIPAERVIAMRLGKGPLEATMGIWVAEQRLFVASESIRVIEPIVPVDAVARDYPGVVLI
jgi:hypothetical protein